MEINAEINKVFGQEMAKLFAAQISEEDMLATAKRIWTDMQFEKSNGWNRTPPEIDTVVKTALKEKVIDQVKALTETDKFKTECYQLAEQIVNEIQEETHRKIVDEVSDRLAGMSVGCGDYGMRGMIEQVIMETLQR